MQDALPTDITYRHYIEREFRARCRRNPSYSLRAYARDLDVHPAKLSEVIRKTCGLSAQSAAQLAPKLKLTEQESEHFVILVEAEHSRSSARKKQALEILKKFQMINGINEIELEKFKVISDWHHNALLELMMLEHFVSSTEWMAEQLNLNLETTQQALVRLEKFGLIQNQNGQWCVTDANLTTTNGIPSREIREHHFQIIQKASESIEDQPVNERDLSSMTMAINEADLPFVQNKLQEFRRSLAIELQKNTKKNRVYCLATQFFPLSKKRDQL